MWEVATRTVYIVIPDPGLFRCVRIYPVHVKLWLPAINGAEKEKDIEAE